MLLLLFAVLGFAIGNRLGMSVRGFVVLAMISITASVDRTWMTLLPMLVGTIIVAGMMIGAVTRSHLQQKTAA